MRILVVLSDIGESITAAEGSAQELADADIVLQVDPLRGIGATIKNGEGLLSDIEVKVGQLL